MRNWTANTSRLFLAATACVGLVAGAAACSSSGGGSTPTTSASAPVTTPAPTGSGTTSGSGTSTPASPNVLHFAHVTMAQYKKLAGKVSKLAGVNNVTYYPNAHRLDVFLKPGTSSKDRAAITALVTKQTGASASPTK